MYRRLQKRKLALPTMLLLLLTVLQQAHGAFYSSESANLFQEKYYPTWQSLYISESDSGYPMPPSSQVRDLLSAFKGIPGIAVKTDPGVTVSEGQGYALFTAGETGIYPTIIPTSLNNM